TNKEGTFKFNGISSGTYQVVITMVGYTSAKQNVIVQNKPETVSMVLGEKQIILNEVIIGDKAARAKHLKTFIKYFMGESSNAKACKIINPDVIEFSTTKGVLMATTPDFLIIENSNLGYSIKYLLKSFSYNTPRDITLYDGDCVFEPLTGTAEQQGKWNKNRKTTYEGSLMHYLRSVFSNTAHTEGFLTYAIIGNTYPITINPNEVPTEQIVRHLDSNFIAFKYKYRFYTIFDKKKAAKLMTMTDATSEFIDDLPSNASILWVDSQIDRRGSYADYKNLLIQGAWGRKRLGDQLPLEYVPN
ncbi:MAG: carboxypeptidase-like regulatory domain-containing protein, partial [Mucilaginibacter sp.]|nr:carboxypeptidase-like regulatory domain-containing protein [Mucilaginibacter sp.]